MNKTVITHKVGEVTVVTLNRPAVRNAVDANTAKRLYDAFLSFEADAESKVAVFHGASGHFCAGWDLQAGAKLARGHGDTQTDPFSDLEFEPNSKDSLGPMGPSRLLLSKPVIAAVSGAAVAGGMELALWCDLRVMEEDAYFGVYCRRFGVPLIDGGTVRLPRLIGMGHAMDLILTGRQVGATESLQMGLCNRVVPTGQSLEAAMALASQLCRFPQKTMLADRMSAFVQSALPLNEALHQEWLRGRTCLSEGVQGAERFSAGEGRHGTFR